MTKKRYRISSGFYDFETVVEVDTELLTEELAREINTFWGGAEERLRKQGGDVVLAVVRLFGSRGIRAAAAEGVDSAGGESSRLFTFDVLKEEGWPGADWKGLRFISIDVPVPGFDELNLEPA